MDVKINLSPPKLDLYTNSQIKVARVLSKCYSRKCTDCELIDEAEIDCLIPPYVAEINMRQIVSRSKGLKDFVIGHIDKIFPKETEELRARLTNLISDVLIHELAGTISPLMEDGCFMQPLPPNQDLDHVLGYTFSDIVGTIKNKMNAKTNKNDFKQEMKRLTMFTAMGCYSNGKVSLCPSRIEASANDLNVDKCILAEVVWVHEEMHSLMNSDVDSDISEHIAQSMTAAALDKLGMHDHLDVMIELAINQPDAYALFALDPNVGLLNSRTKLNNIPGLKNSASSSSDGLGLNKKRIHHVNRLRLIYKGTVFQVNSTNEAVTKLAECMIKEDRARFIRDVLPLRNQESYFTSIPMSLDPAHQIVGEEIHYRGSPPNSPFFIMKKMVRAFGEDPSVFSLALDKT